MAFEGLPASKQAQLFIDINAKQKSVKQSLLQELFAELHWDAEKAHIRVQAIISKAIQVLDADKDSPFHNRIQTADATKDTRRCISLTSVFSAVEKGAFHIVKMKKEEVLEYGPLWAGETELTLDRTVYVVKGWLNEIRKYTAEWWELGAAEGGGLAMNDGITACIAVLRSAFEHLEGKNVKLLHMDNEDLLEAVKPYAAILGRHFGGLSLEHRKGFRDLRGVQGQTARKYRCQQAIQEKMRDFNPPGLSEFLEREKEQTNLRAREILARIEKTLQRVVLEELKREYGDSDNEWWLLGVPKKVRIEVGQRFEVDDGKRETKEAYFELIDYRRIALDRWDVFGPIFGYGASGNKEKKTKWMVDINEMRNLVSHPSSGATLSVEQVAEIEQRERWLEGQIAGMGKEQADDNSIDEVEEGSDDPERDLSK